MREKIINILEDILEIPGDEIINKEENAEWDSLNHVRIIAELQEEFNIKIPSVEINNLNSPDNIENFLKKRKSNHQKNENSAFH
jgi:acyl carrier protein